MWLPSHYSATGAADENQQARRYKVGSSTGAHAIGEAGRSHIAPCKPSNSTPTRTHRTEGKPPFRGMSCTNVRGTGLAISTGATRQKKRS